MGKFGSPYPQIKSLAHSCCDCPNEYSPYNYKCECHKIAAQEFEDGITKDFFTLVERRYKLGLSGEQQQALQDIIPTTFMLNYIEFYKER